MIPNIFISSTIQDLSHLRDSIRDLVLDLGYNPIMSEYGEIGFLPSNSAEDSCYLALRDCHLSIIIVGKRYGSISKNGLSVTHNEFRTARERKVPVIFLVSEEVMSFKRVYDVNDKSNDMSFPGMENPSKVFHFIKEFGESEINNGLVSYNNVQSAKNNLKKQLAHIFGDLLKKQFDPVSGEIKDILSEITTLRHILLKNEQKIASSFSKAFRFLLEEENQYLKDITELVSDSLEKGVPELIECTNINEYFAKNDVDVRILDDDEATNVWSGQNREIFNEGFDKIIYTGLRYHKVSNGSKLNWRNTLQSVDMKNDDVILGIGKKKFWVNKNGEILINFIFKELKSEVTENR